MLKRHGVMLNNLFRITCLLALCLPTCVIAISLGDMTFSMGVQDEFVAKRVLNNNKSARLYRVSVTGIDRPGGKEIRTRPADGELLFAPRQLTLQAGEGEYFKFYYRGQKDSRERYYRVTFREIPPYNRVMRHTAESMINLAPVVVMDTILVIRPRKTDFRWEFDQKNGMVRNIGNTWFKLLIKPGCDSQEENGDAWYLRPGDVVRQSALRQSGEHYIVYDSKFIKISKNCK
ncbi:hypothetical protein [Klebsiella oxytoca]|uniref:hypothetical protein n=1 Tax=Klebsiella oxytoca TaxID=571 RepID=UPI0039C9D981